MRRLLALVAVALGCNIGNAYATTIDFEDLAVDPTFAGGGDRISDGFVIDSSGDHSHVDGGAGIWGTSNGTTFMVFDFNNLITLSPTAGGPFALTSIDVSEANANEAIRAREIQVTGIRFGGGTNPTPLTLSLDAFSTTPVGPNGFQTFSSVFGSDWENLASVTLLGTGDGIGGNYWALDNVVVPDAVPEPGTLTLLGLGSAYLVRRRRRNRR